MDLLIFPIVVVWNQEENIVALELKKLVDLVSSWEKKKYPQPDQDLNTLISYLATMR